MDSYNVRGNDHEKRKKHKNGHAALKIDSSNSQCIGEVPHFQILIVAAIRPHKDREELSDQVGSILLTKLCYDARQELSQQMNVNNGMLVKLVHFYN